jgi:signal transduction histidine kinase
MNDNRDALIARLDELEKRFEAAVQRAKLEAMKELAYGAGHEINNPLANIASRAQTLLQEETDPEKRRKLAAINAQAFRAHEMIADLMLFARPPRLQPKELDLNDLMQSVASQCQEEAGTVSVEISVQVACNSIKLLADPVQLRAAFGSLIKNSLEAMGNQGQIVISVRDLAVGPRNGSLHADCVAELTVADNGPGIPPEVREMIFDPFFSGREAGRGLGFGLSKCWRIVTLHGGEIEVRDTPGGGATFVLRLPATSPG